MYKEGNDDEIFFYEKVMAALWQPGVHYNKGDIVTYKDREYICRNSHTSQLIWAPNLTPSLWSPQSFPSPSPVAKIRCTFCTVCSKNVDTACIKRSSPSPVPAPIPSPVAPPVPNPANTIVYPAVNEVTVTGIPSNATWMSIKIRSSVNMSNATAVYINNPYAFQVSGTTITCLKEGSTCCKIVLGTTTRLFGLYTSGNPPADRLLLGSVSEHDPTNAMRFWSEFDCKDMSDPTKLLCNKKCDLFYVYLNGGPGDYGWRLNYSTAQYNSEPEGKRAFNFLRNSQRLGGYTCFVYYNIPAGGESYISNKNNYNNADYMKSYFYDLNFLLTVINQESPGQTVYIILEPDMLSYILQNEEPSSDGVVHPSNVVFNMSKVSSLNLPEFKDFTFSNTLVSWVAAVNTLIHRKCPQVQFMHMTNLWGSLSGRNWANGTQRGLIPSTTIIGHNAGLNLIKTNALIISNFYKEAGVLLYTNVLCADRYGLDGAVVTASDAKQPQNSRWFWNNDIYMNYIYFVQCIMKNLSCTYFLWQLPCGYINASQERSPYTGSLFPVLTDIPPSGEDGCPCFVFGSTFTRDAATKDYFGADDWKDGVVVLGNTIKWKDHTNFLFNNGIEGVLFGAGVGASTTNLYMGQSGGMATDNKYCISKFQGYYLAKGSQT